MCKKYHMTIQESMLTLAGSTSHKDATKLDFPGSQWLKFRASTAGARVRSRVGELRSHLWRSMAKKKKKKMLLNYNGRVTNLQNKALSTILSFIAMKILVFKYMSFELYKVFRNTALNKMWVPCKILISESLLSGHSNTLLPSFLLLIFSWAISIPFLLLSSFWWYSLWLKYSNRYKTRLLEI